MSEEDNWVLEKIELEFQRWGDDKGKYIGKISFQNGEYESFTFKIKPGMAKSYIDLMARDIVICAEGLS